MILERLSAETGVGVEEIMVIVRSASYRYKTYTIPKVTGGQRKISQPTAAVKFIQRWLARNVFSHFPVHDAAQAYKHGANIGANARIHVKQNYLLKVDFENFFPSIKDDHVLSLVDAGREKFDPALSDEDIEVIVKAVCKDGELTIGAPSSPVISNVLMYDFDRELAEECLRRRVRYSRYADDIALSTDKPEELAELLKFVRSLLKKPGRPLLTINPNKTVFTSRKRLRRLTGIVLTSDREVSIGRRAKRKLRSMIFQYSLGQLSAAEASYLRGYLAFVKSIEPDVISRLELKYGSAVLPRIMGGKSRVTEEVGFRESFPFPPKPRTFFSRNLLIGSNFPSILLR